MDKEDYVIPRLCFFAKRDIRGLKNNTDVDEIDYLTLNYNVNDSKNSNKQLFNFTC